MAQSYAEKVAAQLIEQLAQGTAPWIKSWEPGTQFLPMNPISGRRYRGMNALWLMSMAAMAGYSDRRWLSYNQAISIGAQLQKGEQGSIIQYWQWREERRVTGDNGQPLLDEAGRLVVEQVAYERPRVFSAVVFNAEQIAGMPEAEAGPVLPQWERHELAETMIAASGVALRHLPGDRAYYDVAADRITLPPRPQFASADRYYAMALHELGCATGHASRLHRDLAHCAGSVGHAKETLRADIASLMLGEVLGIGHDPGQHIAYISHWIQILENDPREILLATDDAQKIVYYFETLTPQLAARRDQEAAMESSVERRPQMHPPSMVVEIGVYKNGRWEPFATIDPSAPQFRDAADPVTAANLEAHRQGKQLVTENYAERYSVRVTPNVEKGSRSSSQSLPGQAVAGERSYISVPYAEKDEAKLLGALWDRKARSWYVPENAPLEPFARWLNPPPTAPEIDPQREFADALKAAGFILKGLPTMDGALHRAPVEGDRHGAKSGAYMGYLDSHPAGYYENFKAGIKENWKSAAPREALTPAERASLLKTAAKQRQERDNARRALHEMTVALLIDHLALAGLAADDHPYLVRKQIKPFEVLIDKTGPLEIYAHQSEPQRWSAKGNLLVPLYSVQDGSLLSVQSIGADGRKTFPRGGAVAGGAFQFGARDDIAKYGIVIAEGYSTAATLFEITGRPVAAALSAANLTLVADAYRCLFPTAQIYIAGDNDHGRERDIGPNGLPKRNVGRLAAESAAKAVGGAVVLPRFTAEDSGSDWNDIAVYHGKQACREQWQGAFQLARKDLDMNRRQSALSDVEHTGEKSRTITQQTSKSR